MQLNEIQKGDIILFSALPDKLSRMIAFLSQSDISHAALCYDPGVVIEETDKGMQKKPMIERFKGRKIYVQRLKSDKSLTFNPVIKKADFFFEKHEPYNFADLYLVGFLLLSKRIFPTILDNPYTLAIFKHITSFLVDFCEQLANPNTIPLVCSQFVVECYRAGGEEYHLEFKDTLLDSQKKGMVDGIASQTDNQSDKLQPSNLIEHVLELLETHEFKHPTPSTSTLNQESKMATDIEEQVALLYDLMSEKENPFFELNSSYIDTNNPKESLSQELITTVIDFATVHHKIQCNADATSPTEALNSVLKYQSGFIAPADLYEHTSNLEKVGIIPN